MRDDLALEAEAPVGGMVFVYPDALTRDWGGLRAAGWQNGPVASVTSVFGGEDDLRFIDAVVAWSPLCCDRAVVRLRRGVRPPGAEGVLRARGHGVFRGF